MATPKQFERHNRILTSALKEFCIYGYHQSNVDRIALEANVGKGTIYRHYVNKEGLFLSVFDWNLKKLEKVIREKADFSDFEHGSRVAIKTYLQEVSENPDVYQFFRLFTSDDFLTDHELKQKLADRYLTSSLWAAEEIRAAQKTGTVRKDLDPEKLAYATLGMIHFLIYQWNRDGRVHDLVANTDFIHRILIHGVKSEKKEKEKKTSGRRR